MATPDDVPARKALAAGRRLAERIDGRIDQKVSAHERRLHVPRREMEPLTAVPFAQDRIPDAELAALVELVERGGYSFPEAVEASGYPLWLAEREIARYRARHQRLCQAWAIP